MSNKHFFILVLIILLFTISLSALPPLPPTVNGLFYGDGDNEIYNYLYEDVGMWTVYYYLSGDTIYLAVVVNIALNDNVFAEKQTGSGADNSYVNGVGWIHPGHHEAKDLIKSDSLHIKLTVNSVVWQWGQEYITEPTSYVAPFDPNTYAWDTQAGDDINNILPPSNMEVFSSLQWNLKNTTWDVDQGGDPLDDRTWVSPFIDNSPFPKYPPSYPYFDNINKWEWHMVYEMKIPLESIEIGGFSVEDSDDFTVDVIEAHNSPQKDYGVGAIGDYVWNDFSLDGIQDDFEPGIEDVTVNLYDQDIRAKIDTRQTDSNGYYLFTGLSAGDYHVEFILPTSDWFFTLHNQLSDDTVDSDANPITGISHTIGLSLITQNPRDEPDICLGVEKDITIDAGMYFVDPFVPVILSSFTAAYHSTNATLRWTTQSESQNSHWNIYRGLSGDSDNSQQINVSGMEGSGTTSEPTYYSYTDSDLLSIIPMSDESGVNVWYWLESVDNSGGTDLFGPVILSIISEEFQPDVPALGAQHGLGSNYPNPFNPDTKISCNLKESGMGSLSVYNIKGAKVKELFSERYLEGDKLYFESWNGKDDNGFIVGSGLYMFVLKTDKEFYVRKVILQK